MSSQSVRIAATVAVVASFSASFIGASPIRAEDARIGLPPAGRPLRTLSPSSASALSRTVAEYGRISLSMDALGTTASSGFVHVDKPAGATVRRAFLMATTTGFTYHTLATGDVTLLGSPVVWSSAVPNSIDSWNYWADVTAIVKGHIDAAAPGLVPVAVGEPDSASVDGEVLAVILDDPNKTTDSSVFLYFGAQNVYGDRFVIDFGEPISTSLPGLAIHYSLGISYGYITPETYPVQYSQVEVDGQRLTTSAGGQDDGESANGALITVGGVGDSTANPPDPEATPSTARDDDELYDLLPFVHNGDSSITIDTYNPSNDDNIFFAALEVVGRSIVAVDVDVSLYDNPLSVSDRAPYEEIIGHFADGLYEASNGARKLGRVTFHTNGAYAAQSDVLWTQRCHPSASVSGYGITGLHVNMCDRFRDGAGAGVDYDFLATTEHRRGGGYTLAHEWGHYYFSLYDEYVGTASYDPILSFPHSTDLPVPNSIMNSQWNALGGDYDWLNFSIPKNDTGQTAQFRVYGAAGWPTLARPVSQDPRTGALQALPVRIAYTDLAAVAPQGAADSALDLPGAARSALTITWQTPAPPFAQVRPVDAEINGAETFTISLSSLRGMNLPYPEPLVLLAFVSRDRLLTGLGVTATITAPSAVAAPLRFHDDGVAPDATAGDGLYAAVAPYTQNGLHQVRIAFDNDANSAMLVASAFQPATGVDGSPVAIDAPEPFTPTLHIAKTIDVVVSGVLTDDHGNFAAAATSVPSVNAPTPGRIDYAGDADVFSFTVPLSGTTFVRVTNLALGMDPRLRILSADGVTVRAQTVAAVPGGYVALRIDGVAPGARLYAAVSDLTSSAVGGLYEFSVGPRLASDPAADAPRVLVPFIAY